MWGQHLLGIWMPCPATREVVERAMAETAAANITGLVLGFCLFSTVSENRFGSFELT